MCSKRSYQRGAAKIGGLVDCKKIKIKTRYNFVYGFIFMVATELRLGSKLVKNYECLSRSIKKQIGMYINKYNNNTLML